MMASRSSIRASDADRESVVERLRTAAVEGRIADHELEERIGRAFAAKTYGELDAVVSDLPRVPTAPRRSGRMALARRYPVAALVLGSVAALSVAAAVTVVVAVVASGVWLIPLGIFLYLRIRGGRMWRRYRYADGGQSRTHIHVHRW